MQQHIFLTKIASFAQKIAFFEFLAKKKDKAAASDKSHSLKEPNVDERDENHSAEK